ncbi:MAG: hypothetical protein FWE16_04530 [Firmicutes bacterium]|nr:hypothetical protein [Bacillota bacterium]
MRKADYVSPEKFLEQMRATGFSLAQLYYAFVQWAHKKAEYPVKVALRDGAPIIHTADWLNKQSITDTTDWSPVWLNEFTTYSYFNDQVPLKDIPNIKRYFAQEGLNKPFTYVDTGYSGTLTELFDDARPHRLQTLFLAGSTDFLQPNLKKSREAFLNENKLEQLLKRTFKKDMPIELSYDNDFYENFCIVLFENTPKTTESHEDSTLKRKRLYKNVDGKLEPILKPRSEFEITSYGEFIKGLDKGLAACSDAQQNANPKQWQGYLKELLRATPSIECFMHSFTSFKKRRFTSEKVPVLYAPAYDELLKHRDNIEKIYDMS